MASPTGRTLELLRKCGYCCCVAEAWVPHADRRRDLFGIADVAAAHPARREVLLVQVTVLSCLAARVKKVRARPATRQLLQAGVKVECWGWFRRGGRWKVRRVAIAGDDCTPVEVEPRRRTRRPVQRSLFDG